MAGDETTDDSQKTEDPTARRLEDARKRGQVALSREVNNWVMLLAATILIAGLAGPVFSDLGILMRTYIEKADDIPGAEGGVAVALDEAFRKSAMPLILPFLGLMAAAFLSTFVQIGPIYSTEIIKPDISKISPMKGFGRLFSMKSIVEFVKGLVKISIVSFVGLIILKPYFANMEHMVGLPMELLLKELEILVVKLLVGILVVLAVVAGIDLVYQRMEHMKKMRMSRQEVKDEYKQSDGDPQVKARLRQLRMERARQRMMQAVPQADVVITNPTHFAIALKYKPGEMEAPVCLAKGVDAVALRIREVAKEHDIIVYENPPLARSLYEVVDIDEMIPPEQYKAVAEVISYVFKTRGRR